MALDLSFAGSFLCDVVPARQGRQRTALRLRGGGQP